MAVRVVDPETGADCHRRPRRAALPRPDGVRRLLRDPEETAADIDAEGWFHSGDVGTVDADGRVTFVTRLKDMLKVGGENVAAAEIESHLLTHPAVGMVAVVGAPGRALRGGAGGVRAARLRGDRHRARS